MSFTIDQNVPNSNISVRELYSFLYIYFMYNIFFPSPFLDYFLISKYSSWSLHLQFAY
jgi:hypothetical protein